MPRDSAAQTQRKPHRPGGKMTKTCLCDLAFAPLRAPVNLRATLSTKQYPRLSRRSPSPRPAAKRWSRRTTATSTLQALPHRPCSTLITLAWLGRFHLIRRVGSSGLQRRGEMFRAGQPDGERPRTIHLRAGWSWCSGVDGFPPPQIAQAVRASRSP